MLRNLEFSLRFYSLAGICEQFLPIVKDMPQQGRDGSATRVSAATWLEDAPVIEIRPALRAIKEFSSNPKKKQFKTAKIFINGETHHETYVRKPGNTP